MEIAGVCMLITDNTDLDPHGWTPYLQTYPRALQYQNFLVEKPIIVFVSKSSDTNDESSKPLALSAALIFAVFYGQA